MESNGSLWAILWAAAGAATLKIASYVHSRLTTPTDEVQRRLIADLRQDIEGLGNKICRLDAKQTEQGAQIAFIKGLFEGHDH